MSFPDTPPGSLDPAPIDSLPITQRPLHPPVHEETIKKVKSTAFKIFFPEE